MSLNPLEFGADQLACERAVAAVLAVLIPSNSGLISWLAAAYGAGINQVLIPSNSGLISWLD